MRTISVFIALVATAVEAGAQEPREVEVSGAIVARVSSIAGELDTDLDVGYEDLFGAGFGLAFEADFMFPLRRGWAIGPYVAAGFDVFQGKSDTDEVGDTLDADGLFTSHLMFGFKAMLAPERGFFMDGRVGIGPVFWGETEGELTVGGAAQDVTIFDASMTFAAEIAFHVGFSTPAVFFGAGFAGRSQGKPDEGDLDFEGASNALVGSLEVEIAFRF
jgi:hypothetical protein